MATTAWLADKSALGRIGTSPDADGWAERIDRGLVRIATVTRLELGYSTRSAAGLRTMLETIAPMPVQYLTPVSSSGRASVAMTTWMAPCLPTGMRVWFRPTITMTLWRLATTRTST